MFKSLFEKKLELLENLKSLGVVDLTGQYPLLESILLYNNLPPKKSMSNHEYEEYLKSPEYSNRNEQLANFKEFIMNCSKDLKDGEEKTFSLQHGEYLYFINNQYIISFHEGGMAVFSNNLEPLFYFSPMAMYSNSITDGFTFGNKFLTFKKPIGNDLPIFQFFGKNEELFLSEQKCLRLLFSASINKISMKDNNFLAHFSNNLYSKITLNKDLGIVDVSISKELKTKLKVDLKINNVQTYTEISQKINTHIKDDLEVYTLINDKKLKMKGSQEQFDQDMLLFKESIRHINNIESLYEDNIKLLNKVGDFYLDIKDYIMSNNRDSQPTIRVLNNINILEKYKKGNKNFINNEIFSDIKEAIDFGNKIIKFTYDMDLTKKTVKKIKIKKQ